MCVHRPLRARTGIQTYRAEWLAGGPVSGLSVCRFALADAGARGGGIVHDPAGHHCRNSTRFRVLPLLPQPADSLRLGRTPGTYLPHRYRIELAHGHSVVCARREPLGARCRGASPGHASCPRTQLPPRPWTVELRSWNPCGRVSAVCDRRRRLPQIDRCARSSRSIGSRMLLLFLALVELANVLGPPPPSVRAVAWSAQAMWLLVTWAYWVDRHRDPIA